MRNFTAGKILVRFPSHSFWKKAQRAEGLLWKPLDARPLPSKAENYPHLTRGRIGNEKRKLAEPRALGRRNLWAGLVARCAPDEASRESRWCHGQRAFGLFA